MVNVALIRLEQRASVLATIAVTVANVLRAELRALLWHSREIRQHDYRRHTNGTAHGVDRSVLLANRQTDPFIPLHGTDVIFALDFESCCHTSGHLAKGLCRRPNVDRLPIPVQHQDRCSVNYALHKSVSLRDRALRSSCGRCLFFVVSQWLPALVLPQASPGQSRMCGFHTRRQKMVARDGNSPPWVVCKTTALILS